ncbi:MAG: acyl-CoA dehydrogenase family protein [Myxococcales bacterium]|nr:acyl-CoA dehydrogenase family protein [Myxococcales bacterium]
MHIDFSPEQKALRREIRAYYRELFTPELSRAFDAEREEMGGPVFREIVRRMGADGWLGIGWPKKYGGQDRTPIEQFIFWDETYRARAPLHIIPVNTIGPTLMQYGSEDQKARYLPRILSGELMFGVGYTEPNAGTDLASLQTRAVRDGDEFVINGQKVFTTHAQVADYIWLAARTDPDAPKHKGISIFLVPTDAEGFSVTPIYTLGRERTNATYYHDVRVPADNMVGPENSGWGLITAQLNHERITLATPGHAEALLDEVWEWAGEVQDADGRPMLEQQWVQLHLARVYARLQALQVLNWRSAWSLTRGIPNMAEASALKVIGTEFFVEAYNLLLEIVGASGIALQGQPGALFGGRLEAAYRSATTLTFGGGVNEVQRDIIARAGLGLPRSRPRA